MTTELTLYDGLHGALQAVLALPPDVSKQMRSLHVLRLCVWLDGMGGHLAAEPEAPVEWRQLQEHCVGWLAGFHLVASMHLLGDGASFRDLGAQTLEALRTQDEIRGGSEGSSGGEE